MESTAKELPSTHPTDELTEGDNTGTVIKKSKRSRNAAARRQMSKSEPADYLNDAFDGTQDSDAAVVGSGEVRPLLQGFAV
jgi:hypothetical protein